MKSVIFFLISFNYNIGSIKCSCEKRPFHWTTVWPMEENYVTYRLVGPLANKNASIFGTTSFNNAVAESLAHYEQLSTSGTGLDEEDYIENMSFLSKPVAKHMAHKVYRDPELNEGHWSKIEKKNGLYSVKEPLSSVKKANHPKATVERFKGEDSLDFNQMEDSAYEEDSEFIETPTNALSQKVKNTQLKNYQHPIPHLSAYNEFPRGKLNPMISKTYLGVNDNAGLSRYKGAYSGFQSDPDVSVKDHVISRCKMKKAKKNTQGKSLRGISERKDFFKKGRIYPRQNVQNPKISKSRAQRHRPSLCIRENRSIKPTILVNQTDLEKDQLTNIGDKGEIEEDKSQAHSWFSDLTPWFK